MEKLKDTQQIRTLFSRKHDVVLPRKGVFLAGPTPFDGEMTKGWRRVITSKLLEDERLNPSMVIVSPEPETGFWADIETEYSNKDLEVVQNNQMLWEIQYLNLCDITAFWFPTYWDKESSGEFSPNIGPTARWEFGYYLQEYLKNREQRKFIVGAPADAQNISWAKRMAEIHGIKWHTLEVECKEKQVAQSFIDEIGLTLSDNNWNYKI